MQNDVILLHVIFLKKCQSIFNCLRCIEHKCYILMYYTLGLYWWFGRKLWIITSLSVWRGDLIAPDVNLWVPNTQDVYMRSCARKVTL